jgi:hypothetical protein
MSKLAKKNPTRKLVYQYREGLGLTIQCSRCEFSQTFQSSRPENNFFTRLPSEFVCLCTLNSSKPVTTIKKKAGLQRSLGLFPQKKS